MDEGGLSNYKYYDSLGGRENFKVVEGAFFDDASKWSQQASKDTSSWVSGAADDTSSWVGTAASDTTKFVDSTGREIGDWTTTAAGDTAAWTAQATTDTGKWFEQAGIDIEKGIIHFGENLPSYLQGAVGVIGMVAGQLAVVVGGVFKMFLIPFLGALGITPGGIQEMIMMGIIVVGGAFLLLR